MTEQQTLVEFLEARLREDEDAARAADAAVGGTWMPKDDGVWGTAPGETRRRKGGEVCEWRVCNANEIQTPHIARHDPARVLREVEVLRAVIQRRKDLDDQIAIVARDPAQQHNLPMITSPAYALEMVLRRFALVHEDHPNFRDEWRLPSPDTW